MKVFISWSGNKSHRVALVFREWLPSVIQSVEPYVSSEDIDKGARWSTDIAKELENSTFGILCVTKENLEAPWLSFEAGALSKTMDKSFVTPFLFDIKRSEVNGPILQFQSTIFDKEDIKKLLQTLNKACGESGITEAMLDKAFEVWYPTLEKELNGLHDVTDEGQEEPDIEAEKNPAIIEEILELSRDNQKLLRNPDTRIIEGIDELKQRLEVMIHRAERNADERHLMRKDSMMFFDELVHGILPTCQRKYAFLIVINMVQDEFPWIYSMGKGLVDTLESKLPYEEKCQAINDCKRLIDLTFDRNVRGSFRFKTKDSFTMLRERQFMLRDILMEMLFGLEEDIRKEPVEV